MKIKELDQVIERIEKQIQDVRIQYFRSPVNNDIRFYVHYNGKRGQMFLPFEMIRKMTSENFYNQFYGQVYVFKQFNGGD